MRGTFHIELYGGSGMTAAVIYARIRKLKFASLSP